MGEVQVFKSLLKIIGKIILSFNIVSFVVSSKTYLLLNESPVHKLLFKVKQFCAFL